MAGIGLANLMMGAGAGEGLEALISRQLLAQRQAETERAARVDEGQRGRQLDELVKSREATATENQRYHDELAAGRQATVDESARAAKEREGVQRLNIRLASLRPGADVAPDERDYLIGQGLSPSSFDLGDQTTDLHPLGPHDKGMPAPAGVPRGMQNIGTSPAPTGALSPPHYRYQGKVADQQNAERINEGEERAHLHELNALTMAQLRAATDRDTAAIRAAAPKGGGGGKVMTFRGPNGENLSAMVDGTGQILFQAPSQLPAGMKGKEADSTTLISQIDAISNLGDRTGWGGTGVVTAPFQGMRKRVTGGGSNTADGLRIALDSVKADIAHEKYGAAFTNTERAMLSSFAPGSNMNGQAIKNRLAIMRAVISKRLQELSQGLALEAASPIDLSGRGRTQPPTTTPAPPPSAAPAAGGGNGGGFKILSVEP